MKYCPKCQQQYNLTQRLCPADGELLSLADPYYLVGRTLMEKYRIEALVGIGGMGAVYSARNQTISRRVAFKILLPNLALGNESMLNLFQREAVTAGQLGHDNIVDIYDAGRTPNGIAYIVMEWLEGQTLQDVLDQGEPFSLERAGELLSQVSAALDHAHAHRIVHRDLKPSNIMLAQHENGREQVKVLDFGIAKVMSETTTSPVSRMLGTPHYASPEQFIPGAHLDGRSDIYSLGVILYQMLTARLPFYADAPIELVRMHRTENPPPLRRYRPDIPASIEQLVTRMLAKNPQSRPATATEAAKQFDRIIRSSELAKTAYFFGPETKHAGRAETNKRVSFDNNSVDLLATTEPEAVKASPAQTKIKPEVEGPNTSKLTKPADYQSISSAAEPEETKTNNMRGVLWILAGFLVLLIVSPWIYRYLKQGPLPQPNLPSNPTPTRVDLMSYYLEVHSGECGGAQRGERVTGDQPIKAGQFFRFHFIPRERGYLYIIAPGDNNTPTALLTAQPHPDTGVNTNFIGAGEDYTFPANSCLGVTKDERMMAFTIILSPKPIVTPGFLTGIANRPLIASEQIEFDSWRQQYAAGSTEIIPDFSRRLSLVERIQSESIDSDRPVVPVVFDLFVKRQ